MSVEENHMLHLNYCSYFHFRELGIGIVAYSPLGRGFFSAGAKLVESLSDQDFRKVNSMVYYLVFPKNWDE